MQTLSFGVLDQIFRLIAISKDEQVTLLCLKCIIKLMVKDIYPYRK